MLWAVAEVLFGRLILLYYSRRRTKGFVYISRFPYRDSGRVRLRLASNVGLQKWRYASTICSLEGLSQCEMILYHPIVQRA